MNTLLQLSFILSFSMIGCGQSPQNIPTREDTVSYTDSVHVLLNDGLYKSSDSSYRKNFYLRVVNNAVTLFGWEIKSEGDTVYYKATTTNTARENNEIRLKFDQYEFSIDHIADDSLEGFKADKKTEMLTFLLHRYFQGKASDGKLELIAMKDSYDSRFDKFEFVKIK